MPFDAEKFLLDHSIPYTTSGKHARPGWVQIACPFCVGNPGWHGGFCIQDSYYNCWRCGHHTMAKVIRKLTNATSWGHAKFILEQYTTQIISHQHRPILTPKPITLELPKGCGPLKRMHLDYLRGRNFDPHQLVREWGLQGTGPLGRYNFRIIAPIYVNNQLVSYQGRDVTGRSPLKYKACRMVDEIIHHKHTLYGLDQSIGDTAVVVEGITDVWRLGPGSLSTFGIEFTTPQIEVLASRFKRIVVVFDEDPQAIEQANTLAHQLAPLRIDVARISLHDVNDPADLAPDDAKRLMREIMS